MKRYTSIICFLFVNMTLSAQDVIIKGVNKNRPLEWDDFTGTPDKTSTYDAHTYWNLNYSYKGVTYSSDTARIKEPMVTLELDKKLSWVKRGKENPWLLKHEQGHFDIGLICQKEMIDRLNSIVLTRSDFRDKVQSVFRSVLDKYKAMGLQYDEETNHGKSREKQEKWNAFFASELKTGNGS